MEHVVQFDATRRTLPGLDMCATLMKVGGARAIGRRNTGGAWLSSARVVRCWVKSRNERNPYCMLPAPMKVGRHSCGTAPETGRKVGTTSSQHAPYVLGYTHATMGGTEGSETARWSQSQKAVLSWDRSLQLDFVNLESLVTAGQHHCGEYVPGPCTHRPSSDESRLHPKSLAQSRASGTGGAEGAVGDWR